MYKLKQVPEDFVVIEIPSIKIGQQGKYCYFWIKKTGRNTRDVVKELSKLLLIKEKEIGFAGSKDKHAVTAQMLSIFGKKKEEVEKIKFENVSLEFCGYGNIPISLGDLQGNKFEVVIRNLSQEKIEIVNYVENYFDEQRFSENNVNIGRYILKKEFSKAVVLIDELKVAEHLKQKPTDYVGALKVLPLRQLRMYVNAYQSYLWNKTVAAYLARKGKLLKKISYSCGELAFISDAERFKDLKITLIGFGYEEVEDEEVQEIINNIMKEEDISSASFIIKQIPELTLEGEMRNVFVEVKNIKVEKKTNDELNLGKQKVKVSFTLPKGSYATMAIKRIVS